ncbi:hypothetical protein QUW13_06275 [Enterococcus hirae]|nr:hypothetical protein [Enterococcaceae bacterium]MCI1919607.1 hypothetical protein [Enterococcaceae bacterium]MDM8213478.1 hypothetical protein [Enterococcus hirae]
MEKLQQKGSGILGILAVPCMLTGLAVPALMIVGSLLFLGCLYLLKI